MKAPRRMTFREFVELGKSLYGEDRRKWKFRCPICGNEATVEDFELFKGEGATPESARFKCIGRYVPLSREAFPTKEDAGAPDKPCNYTLGGLFKFPAYVVTYDGSEMMSFAFADDKEAA